MSAWLHDATAWTLALALCVPGFAGRPGRAMAVLAVLAAVLHVPVGEVDLLTVLRGVSGSPSVVTLVLLGALFAARCGAHRVFAPGEALLVAGLAALTGALFYPPALGLGPVDPYAWGYGEGSFTLAVGGVSAVAWLAGRRVLALALVAALAAWRLGWLESSNLWDYLIDVPLAAGSLVALVVAGVARLRAPSRA